MKHEPVEPVTEEQKFVRAATPGVLIGLVAGLALVFVLRSVLGAPANFVPKAIAVVLIVAAFGGFVSVMISHARRSKTASRS